jgi:hypothetical protein
MTLSFVRRQHMQSFSHGFARLERWTPGIMLQSLPYTLAALSTLVSSYSLRLKQPSMPYMTCLIFFADVFQEYTDHSSARPLYPTAVTEMSVNGR